ncbi:alkaline phosphatase family protein [bacterium]|nr:alkaline phosphatase family protein [bacterium]
MRPNNILFVTADQWRGDCLSILGHPTVKTPNLDTLAGEGVLFRNHFAQCIPCGPSRASIYTGTYQNHHRVIENGVPLDARLTNIALEFKKLGYDPALAGYTDTAPDPRQYAPDDDRLKGNIRILPGFDTFLGMSSEHVPGYWAQWLKERGYELPENLRDLYYESVVGYPGAEKRGKTFAPAPYSKEESDTAFLTDRAEVFIRESSHKPWFLHLSYFRPHRPYLAAEPYNRLYDPETVPPFKRAVTVKEEARQHPFLAYLLEQGAKNGSYTETIFPRDEKSMQQLRATYYGLMTEVDDHIGKIIKLLKDTGQYKNTLIVFLSDHGAQLGDHHLMMPEGYFDQSFHIPLIIRLPDSYPHRCSGISIDEFTENVDLLPTLMDLFESPIPRQCAGRSLLPFMTGRPADGWRTEVHWEGDFRYLDAAEGYDAPDQALGIDRKDCVFGVIRDTRYKYVHFAALPPLFFDLQNDPDELQDLSGYPEYSGLLLEYAGKMLSWRMTSNEKSLTHLMVDLKGVVELE